MKYLEGKKIKGRGVKEIERERKERNREIERGWERKVRERVTSGEIKVGSGKT